jgi:hypothetical protein
MTDEQKPRLKKDGTPRKKPGPKPGTKQKAGYKTPGGKQPRGAAALKGLDHPSCKFDADAVNDILKRHADGELIIHLVKEHGIAWSTFWSWVKSDTGGIREPYEQARDAFWEHQAQQMIEIAEDGTNDYVETKSGPMLNKEAVMRSKLRVDTRQWLLAKRRPERYGDKSQLEVTGKNGGPVQHEHRESAREKVLGELDQTRRRLEGANQNSSTGSANGHANGKANGHA